MKKQPITCVNFGRNREMKTEESFFNKWAWFLLFLGTVAIGAGMGLILAGCGHNVFTEARVTGLDATVPVYGTVIGVRIGHSDIVTAATRGNSAFSAQGTTGGGLLSATGGTGRYCTMIAGPQLNEGYMRDTLAAPDVPDDVKAAIAQYYLSTGAPVVGDGATRTIGASTGSGTNPPKVEPVTTGVDKVVDRTAEVVTAVTPEVTDMATSVVSDVSDSYTVTIKKVGTVATWAVVVIGIILLILLIIIVDYIKKKIDNWLLYRRIGKHVDNTENKE